MRWTKKLKEKKVVHKPTKKRIPEIGDEKIETAFALFPTKITYTDSVWLETYEIVYEFKEITRKKHKITHYSEDGSPCYHGPLGVGYETYKSKEWIEKRKQYKS